MIENLVITGIHFNVDEDLKKYVVKKIGNLDRYLSRHARESVRVEVRLKENHNKDKKTLTCEITVHLPHDTIVIKESTMNIYAAVDIAEATVRNQLVKHKTETVHSKLHKTWLLRREERRN
jgi:ribosomal subunit interface protein